MKAALILTASVGAALMALASRAVPAEPSAVAAIPTSCASCHALTRPENPTVDRLWNRKGPDLWYAGDKFNREWLVNWLQNPTHIRPGGVMWFKHAKAGDPRDTLDTDAVEKHPSVDAATATQLADSLLQLKGEGLVNEGEAKSEGANMAMAKMSFVKLRGCGSCHQDKPGQGGLSGPEFYDAGVRLKPDYVLAYMRDPQSFDRFVWMPRMPLNDTDLQRLTAYISTLGKEAP